MNLTPQCPHCKDRLAFWQVARLNNFNTTKCNSCSCIVGLRRRVTFRATGFLIIAMLGSRLVVRTFVPHDLQLLAMLLFLPLLLAGTILTLVSHARLETRD